MSNAAVTEERAKRAPPMRLHHSAYVCADQERTRQFYEDVLGIPLVAFWVEEQKTPEGEPLNFSHAFYGLPDGSALAFFNFHGERARQAFAAKRQEMFVHLAINVERDTQTALNKRLEEHGWPVQLIDHGYTHSIYVRDPDGLLLEFASDPENVEEINAWQRSIAHEWLRRWQDGDVTVNNTLQPHRAVHGSAEHGL